MVLILCSINIYFLSTPCYNSTHMRDDALCLWLLLNINLRSPAQLYLPSLRGSHTPVALIENNRPVISRINWANRRLRNNESLWRSVLILNLDNLLLRVIDALLMRLIDADHLSRGATSRLDGLLLCRIVDYLIRGDITAGHWRGDFDNWI